MDGDVAEDTVMMRADLRVVLAGLPLFAGLDERILAAIAAEVEWISLPGGATLFEAGEPADSMYVLLSGCLGAYATRASDRRRFSGRITAGDTVGEMGLVSGRPRNAKIVALRDSELARLSRGAFDRVFRTHPEAMLRIAQLTVDRYDAAASPIRGRSQGARTFTLLPQSLEVDVAGFAADFVKALRQRGRAELVWSVRGADHTSHWFHKVEAANDFVVYVADPLASPWSRLCMRQADSLVLVARADSPAEPWPQLVNQRESNMTAQRAELVLLHEGQLTKGAAARWLGVQQGIPHHHVVTSDDVPRVARLLTGHAVGIVLSGGGARGFAHIGAVMALRDAGVPIDLVGGTSMGGILGAGVAAGWGPDELIERFRRTFVETNPLHDYTLPIVSLVSGRKVSHRLRQEFEDRAIEDLPLPFFCVSANLTTGLPHVHRHGELWRWLRASVAIPGVLPPVLHKGEVFVDGGAINNLPVDVMREMGRGAIIASDVGADRAFTADEDDVDVPPLWKFMSFFRGKRRRPNIFQILWRSGMVNSAAMTAVHREQTDLLLQPPLESVDMLNWRAFDRAIAAGYAYTAEKIEALPEPTAARIGFRRRGFSRQSDMHAAYGDGELAEGGA